MNELLQISLGGIGEAGLSGKRAVARRIDAALKTLGFFVIKDTSVDWRLVDEAMAAATAFFDLPPEAKMQVRSVAKGSPRGYVPYGLETLSFTHGETTAPDIKEAFGIGPPWVEETEVAIPELGITYNPNRWPDEPPGFRPTMEAFYGAMKRLGDELMELFAIGMDLPPDFFVPYFTRHNSTLRLFNYPAQDAAPEPGQLRAGPHTDYGALTILAGQDRPGGLQVRTPSGAWIDAKVSPGSFVVNIGDLMMTWSNDTWVSNLHRVANPPVAAGPASRRLSLGFFCNPNEDAEITCLPTCCSQDRPAKHAPVRAGEHRFRKIALSQGERAAGG